MSPFALLARLEQLGRDHGADLPSQEEHQELWPGIGFRLGGQLFVTALDEVAELLRHPSLSPIPRTKAWVRGMANVRGNLLPVMDLGGYLVGKHSSLTRSSRVVVIDIDGVFSGLLVDEVFGMRQFPRDDHRAPPGNLPEHLQPYVTGCFNSGGDQWLLFSMRALAAAPQFLKVAS